MNEKKYLNEEKYQKNNLALRKLGKILLIIGIVILVASFVMIISGFIGFGQNALNSVNMNSFENRSVIGSFGLFTIGGFVNIIGFVLTVAGGMMLFISHKREITAYTTQQVIPVVQEGIEKMTPTVADAAGSIAKSIKTATDIKNDK